VINETNDTTRMMNSNVAFTVDDDDDDDDDRDEEMMMVTNDNVNHLLDWYKFPLYFLLY
jgi:hypothetical protein